MGAWRPLSRNPEQGGPFAPVVIYMDAWGLREELYDIARKVAVVGYYVGLTDFYYRQGRIRHQWRNERGQMISIHNLDPERQAQVRAPLEPMGGEEARFSFSKFCAAPPSHEGDRAVDHHRLGVRSAPDHRSRSAPPHVPTC